MAHLALYRKWRPTVFEDIVGQRHITETLKKQINDNTIGHAYLFCGTRGTGKTTCAKVFSRAINCLHPQNGSPCNECEICRGISDGSILDVIELDAASNRRIDDIREIINDVSYVATAARYSVYIIDEVHMLTKEAFNALLKTLEEPPEHVIFILATTDPQTIPETILSRCQRFDFRRISVDDIILRLREVAYGDGFKITDDAYKLIARLGDGSMRDALSILERVSSACGDTITAESIISILGISSQESVFKITDAIIGSNPQGIISVIDLLMSEGRDLNTFIDTLMQYFRDLMMCSVSENSATLLDYSSEDIVKLKAQSKKLRFERLTRAVSILSGAKSDARWVKSPRVIYELALIKLARPETDTTPEALMDRLSQIEGLEQGSRDEELYARINNIEEKIKNGLIAVSANNTEKKEEKPPEKKKKVSKRVYNPIPRHELNGDNPIVQLAKKWDSISAAMSKKGAYLTFALTRRPITIDRDGIIMLFRRDESYAISVLDNNKKKLDKLFANIAGPEYALKYVYEDEIGDEIVDIWSLKPSSAKFTAQKISKIEKQNNESDKNRSDIPVPDDHDVPPLPDGYDAPPPPDDYDAPPPDDYDAPPPDDYDAPPDDHDAPPPQDENNASPYEDRLDELIDDFGDIVEITDGTEFVNYNKEDDHFEQEDLLGLHEDDREEFIDEDEWDENDKDL